MGTHNICLYKEVDKNYTGCNLKTMELLDCALMGACVVVIRSNTVMPFNEATYFLKAKQPDEFKGPKTHFKMFFLHFIQKHFIFNLLQNKTQNSFWAKTDHSFIDC